MCSRILYNLNPPGCGALFLRRATAGACKKQTAFLLRLADFRGAGRCPLAKTGALRQTQLPVSSTGCGRCVCPCSASPVSAAGSGSAAQPSTPLMFPRPAAAPLDRGSVPFTSPSSDSRAGAARRGHGSAAASSLHPEGAVCGSFPPEGGQLRRCLRQKQPKRSRGKHSDRILWMKQGAVFGAALRFSQAGTAPRRENRPSARGTRSAFYKRAATRAVYLANGNPEQRSDFCKRPPRRAAKTG